MNNGMDHGVYLDNAAAAMPSVAILRRLGEYARKAFVNQEAIHRAAYRLRQEILEHGHAMLDALCGSSHGAFLHWCDSGTDALVRIVSHPFFTAGEVVTTGAEHPALAGALARLGVPLRQVRLRHGLIDPEHLQTLLSPATRLVALHHVQSETGALQNLVVVRTLMDRLAPQALLLADTVQSVGKHELPWCEARLDFAVVSGYKLGVPGGAAVLGREREVNAEKLSVWFNALRQKEHRVGRANPALILTLADETVDRCRVMKENRARVANLNIRLRRELTEQLPVKPVFAVDAAHVTPYILHFLLPGYQGAVLVRMLSEHEVFIASGSACNAETATPSPALLVSGIKPRDAFAGLRISFSPESTDSDAERFLAALRECLAAY